MGRVGIFGGSFNPPHRGHFEAVSHAIGALGLDKLLLVPTGIAPCKTLPADSPSPAQRYEMLRLMTRGESKIEVSDIEICREGICYTYDTLAQLRQQYPQDELVLLMGSDKLASFPQWERSKKILSMASLGVLCREGYEQEQAIAEAKAWLKQQGATVYQLQNPVVEISSTQLRRMLVFDCAEAFLPAGVGDYIRTNRLYGVDRDYRNLSEAELEQVVISLLKPNRVAHVLGCRDAAVALAKHWGADPVAAARAALLHDVTKALDAPLQLTLCNSYGMILDDFSQRYPKTLHALTGSLVAERVFGETREVVDAICSHTTGKANMNLLEIIVYVADYMEPNRNFPGVEELRRLAVTDLDRALQYGLNMTIAHLKRQNAEISPASLQTLQWLDGKMNSIPERI